MEASGALRPRAAHRLIVNSAKSSPLVDSADSCSCLGLSIVPESSTRGKGAVRCTMVIVFKLAFYRPHRIWRRAKNGAPQQGSSKAELEAIAACCSHQVPSPRAHRVLGIASAHLRPAEAALAEQLTDLSTLGAIPGSHGAQAPPRVACG